MVKGEYGITLQINAGTDLSGYSSISLIPRRPDNNAPVSIVNDDITVGVVDVVVELTRSDGVKFNKTFMANNYIEYVTKDGEFIVEGDYPAKLIVDFGSGKRLKSIDTNIFIDE